LAFAAMVQLVRVVGEVSADRSRLGKIFSANSTRFRKWFVGNRPFVACDVLLIGSWADGVMVLSYLLRVREQIGLSGTAPVGSS